MITELLYAVVILAIVNLVAEDATPEDVRMYYADYLNIPLVGGVVVYIKWQKLL